MKKKISMNRNPSGKGGFGENPQNSAGGFWKSEDSIPFNQKKFLRMSLEEFEKWTKENPKQKRTVAQDLAYESLLNARNDFKYHKDLIDRTSGTSVQSIDVVSNGETIVQQPQIWSAREQMKRILQEEE